MQATGLTLKSSGVYPLASLLGLLRFSSSLPPGKLGRMAGGLRSGRGLAMQPRRERAWWGGGGPPGGTRATLALLSSSSVYFPLKGTETSNSNIHVQLT